jgi:hypothetical protein
MKHQWIPEKRISISEFADAVQLMRSLQKNLIFEKNIDNLLKAKRAENQVDKILKGHFITLVVD